MKSYSGNVNSNTFAAVSIYYLTLIIETLLIASRSEVVSPSLTSSARRRRRRIGYTRPLSSIFPVSESAFCDTIVSQSTI
jgi:hypothetical protein